MGALTLKIVTARGALEPVRCGSVHLTLCDGAKGRGGGSYGVRPGHARALFALDAGPVTALDGGQTVLSGQCAGGFAAVEPDTVTVITERFSREL